MPAASTDRNDKAKWGVNYLLITVLMGFQGYQMVSPAARPDAWTATQAAAQEKRYGDARSEDKEDVLRMVASIADAALLLANKLDTHLDLRMHLGAEVAIAGLKSDLRYIRETLTEVRDRLKDK